MGLRLTQNEYEAYVKLGAGKWLRSFLREHYKYLIESNAAETAKNPNQNELDLV